MTKEIKVPVADILSARKDTSNEMLVNGSDIAERKAFEEKLKQTNEQLKAQEASGDAVAKAELLLDKVNSLLALGRKKDIWNDAKKAFDVFIENHRWEQAAETCDVMYQSEQEGAIKAMIHGIWLAVSFPVDPEVSVILLDHLVDETPPNADGAAVAAATAHYLVGLRASEEAFENLDFYTTRLLSTVAEKHSRVTSQEMMDEWLERMQLKDPAVFLPRLGMVLNAVVPLDEWWFDRDELRKHFPQ